METKNQTAQESAQSGVVDYAAALRQYHRYGRGRSMKKFCEDEGYDYWKFCKLAREVQSEMDAKNIADKHPVFIEVNPDGTQSSVQRDEPMKVCEIRIRFNNGLVMSRKGGDVEEVISALFCRNVRQEGKSQEGGLIIPDSQHRTAHSQRHDDAHPWRDETVLYPKYNQGVQRSCLALTTVCGICCTISLPT